MIRFFARTWLRYVRVFATASPPVCRLSVSRLSSETFVYPTQGFNFSAIFLHRCVPWSELVILWPPCKISRRSSQRNLSVGDVKRIARGVANRAILDPSKATSHKRYKILPSLGYNYWLIGNDTCGIHWYNFQWPWPIRNPDFKVIWVLCCQ